MEKAFADFQLSQVPTYRLYGPDGSLVKQFDTKDTAADIEAYIGAQLPHNW